MSSILDNANSAFSVAIYKKLQKQIIPLSEKLDGLEENVQLIEAVPGPKGKPGIRGDKGIKGDRGNVGQQGLRGETGIQGPKGDTGLKGDQGIKGDQGETGPQGPPGPSGGDGTPISPDDLTKYDGGQTADDQAKLAGANLSKQKADDPDLDK